MYSLAVPKPSDYFENLQLGSDYIRFLSSSLSSLVVVRFVCDDLKGCWFISLPGMFGVDIATGGTVAQSFHSHRMSCWLRFGLCVVFACSLCAGVCVFPQPEDMGHGLFEHFTLNISVCLLLLPLCYTFCRFAAALYKRSCWGGRNKKKKTHTKPLRPS